MSRVRAILLVLLALTAFVGIVLAAGETAEREPDLPQDADIELEEIGEGAQAAFVVTPKEISRPLPLVIFFHGWAATDPAVYGAWMVHLARQGNAVVYPVYQSESDYLPSDVTANALDGVRAATEEIDVPLSGTVVAAGHSAGGTIAANYAAIAERERLPVPDAVYSVYPGRADPSFPEAIPLFDLDGIPRTTRVVSVHGADDDLAGDATARGIIRRLGHLPADRRRLVLIDDPAVDDHAAPVRADAAVRREIWAPLDRLIERAR